MTRHLPFRTISSVAVLIATLLVPVMAKSSSKRAKKDQQPQLRLICASSLSENQQAVLASCDAEGKWQELGDVALRASLITEWLPARAGELHLALREEGTLKSICKFDYPADTSHALAVLVADPERNGYDARVVDPKKSDFAKGSVLIFNFSPHAGVVLLGPKEEKVEAGQQSVAKPELDGNGMYRMMVSYVDDQGKNVSCYDRQVSGNTNSRNMLLLVPDKILGVRILSLPIFGALE